MRVMRWTKDKSQPEPFVVAYDSVNQWAFWGMAKYVFRTKAAAAKEYQETRETLFDMHDGKYYGDERMRARQEAALLRGDVR